LRLAAANLSKYPSTYESLDLTKVQNLIDIWMSGLEVDRWTGEVPPGGSWPRLSLETEDVIRLESRHRHT
jgi:hypothetical protein